MLIKLYILLYRETTQRLLQPAVTGPRVKKPRGARARENKETHRSKDTGP